MKRIPVGTPVALAALLLLAGIVHATESQPLKADFSGTWRLNVARSQFGALPALVHLEDRIVQTDAELRVHRTQANEEREITTDFVYKLDGTDVSRKTAEAESHIAARLSGSSLIVDIHMITTGMDMKVHDRWTLSHDKKTIEIERHYGSPTGSMKQKLILEKQP